MKQMTPYYPMTDFPIPSGLQEVNVGGGFFGRGERYYLTENQRALLDEEPTLSSSGDDGDAPKRRSIFDSFLNLFR